MYDDHVYVTDNVHLHSGFSKKKCHLGIDHGRSRLLATVDVAFPHPRLWVVWPESGWLSQDQYPLAYRQQPCNFCFLFFGEWPQSKWRSYILCSSSVCTSSPPCWTGSLDSRTVKTYSVPVFWMLTLCAYASYVKRPGFLVYSFVLVLFILGLMAKPMLVTLPLWCSFARFLAFEAICRYGEQRGRILILLYSFIFVFPVVSRENALFV